jgi:hypothetical protein
MLKMLLLARRRHYLNFVRHHFDRPTLLILAGIGVLVACLLWRAPADIGVSMGALGRAGFGRRWTAGLIPALPLVYAVFFLLARVSVRRTPEFDLLRCLPVPDSTVTAWLRARHLLKTGPLLLGLALPALGDSRLTVGGVLRAGALLAALSGLDLLALWHARKGWPARRRADRRPWPVLRFPGRGGIVFALVIRDVSYLLRRRRSVPLLLLAAAVGEALAALTIDKPTDALTAAAVLQAVHGLLQLGFLEALFEREAATPGFLKCLPVGGARVWRARLLLSAALLALPGVAPLAIGVFKGASPAAAGMFLLAALLVGPITGGLLFADVHVALFPRTRIATFLLTMALVSMVLLWFFVPFASPLLALALLLLWGSRAATAFDRVEVE